MSPVADEDMRSRSWLAPLCLAAIMLAHANTASAQRPQMPRVRAEPCTGYCRTEWASCKTNVLRATPSPTASIVARIDSGEIVHVLAGERRTTRPGIVVIRKPVTLVQHLSGPDDDITPPRPKRWRMKTGDTVYVVDIETDGDSYKNYIWVYRGHEDTTAAFWDASDSSRSRLYAGVRTDLIAEMDQAWWARVRTAAGKEGWVKPEPGWTGTSYYDDPLSKCARKPATR